MIRRHTALALLALGMLGATGLVSGGIAAPADDKQALVDEAGRLLERSRTHVSYASLLRVLQDRAAVVAGKCPDAGIKAFDEDLGVQAGTYRNVSVAAQQSFQVVIEMAGQWQTPKLTTLLERGKKDLLKAEELRSGVAAAVATKVLTTDASGDTLDEIRSGRWSGFEKPALPKGEKPEQK